MSGWPPTTPNGGRALGTRQCGDTPRGRRSESGSGVDLLLISPACCRPPVWARTVRPVARVGLRPGMAGSLTTATNWKSTATPLWVSRIRLCSFELRCRFLEAIDDDRDFVRDYAPETASLVTWAWLLRRQDRTGTPSRQLAGARPVWVDPNTKFHRCRPAYAGVCRRLGAPARCPPENRGDLGRYLGSRPDRGGSLPHRSGQWIPAGYAANAGRGDHVRHTA